MDTEMTDPGWHGLSDDDKDQIRQIIATFFNANIVSKHGTPADNPTEYSKALSGIHWPKLPKLPNLPNPWCKIAVDTEEAAAVTACATLTTALAGICIIAAHEVADAKRAKC